MNPPLQSKALRSKTAHDWIYNDVGFLRWQDYRIQRWEEVEHREGNDILDGWNSREEKYRKRHIKFCGRLWFNARVRAGMMGRW